MNEHKITTLTIMVPYRSAGNVIKQHPVQLEIFKDENAFRAMPLLSEDERTIANLPPNLLFEYKDGKIISSRGNRDGNFHVLRDIVEVLKEESLI